MDGPSPIFDEYAQDLNTLIQSTRTKLNNEVRQHKSDERRKILDRLEIELDEADEIIGQMEIEVQTAGLQSDKQALSSQLKIHKASLSKLRTEIKQLESNSDRDDLLSTSSQPHVSIPISTSSDPLRSHSPALAQRAALMSATDKLSEGQRRLEDSHRVALETENLGAGILRDLRDQRDVLEHARDGLYEADGSIDRASNTIGKMVRVMYQQRAVTYAIIALLILLILYVLFSKLF